MASLQRYQGRGKDAGKVFFRIQPYINGKRVTLRLGTGFKKAEKARKAIADLIESLEAEVDPSAESKAWLANVASQSLCSSFLKYGLINEMPGRFSELPNETALTITTLCDKYIRQFGAGKARSTITIYEQAKNALVEYFGDVDVTSLTFDHGRDYWTWLIGKRGLAPNTAKQRVRYARAFFALAIEDEVIKRNPFKAKGLNVTQTSAVKSYVPRSTIEKVIESCPSLEWMLLFAMVRSIPMRVPSEIEELSWCDIDWSKNTILIHSPKTRHLGKHARLVPVFDHLVPLLSQAFDAARDGETYLFPTIRNLSNVGKIAADIVVKAKIKIWPNFFNSLRASAETDLMDSHGLRMACQWAGNSPETAIKNYALVHHEDYTDSGRQKVDAKSDAIPASVAESADIENTENTASTRIEKRSKYALVGRAGLEPATKGL